MAVRAAPCIINMSSCSQWCAVSCSWRRCSVDLWISTCCCRCRATSLRLHVASRVLVSPEAWASVPPENWLVFKHRSSAFRHNSSNDTLFSAPMSLCSTSTVAKQSSGSISEMTHGWLVSVCTVNSVVHHFHSCTVHLNIIKVLLFHEQVHYIFV